MSFAVLTDTSGNLQNRQIEDYDLKVIPFPYYIDGRELTCLDPRSFDGDAYYDAIRGGVRVTTSLIPPQKYMDFFERELRQGRDIVFVSMSSGISGSCAAAHTAAGMLREEYPQRRIEIVDSLGASLGEGLLAVSAAKLRNRGMSATEAAAELRSQAKRMCNIFTVDDLMYLKRGGRLSNLSAIVGTVLNVKPILKGNEEGKIVAFAKLRGRKHAIEALAAAYDKLVVEPEQQTVGIAQAGCREEAALLARLLRRNRPPREILNVQYEPVTGSYVGPGALALFFESTEDVRGVSSL